MRLIGHDLSNPLTAIRILAEMLAGELPSDEMRQDMQDVLEAADLATSFIESLTAMISMEEDEESFTRFLVDLRDVVSAAQRRPALVKQVECTLPDQPVRLIGERYPLQQAVTDVLLNARKLSGTKCKVKVHMDVGEEEVSVVCATEVGHVPLQLRPRLLELFGSVDVRQQRIPVAAVGLAYAANIADRHGGRIEMRDTDEGFAIVLTLPIGNTIRY